jgi:predicted Zn-dependent peptidase
LVGWTDIKNIKRDDCINFYNTYYAPNNATIVVVGDVDTKDVLEKNSRCLREPFHRPQSQNINFLVEPVRHPMKEVIELQKEISSEKFLMGLSHPKCQIILIIQLLEIAHCILFDGKEFPPSKDPGE